MNPVIPLRTQEIAEHTTVCHPDMHVACICKPDGAWIVVIADNDAGLQQARERNSSTLMFSHPPMNWSKQ